MSQETFNILVTSVSLLALVSLINENLTTYTFNGGHGGHGGFSNFPPLNETKSELNQALQISPDFTSAKKLIKILDPLVFKKS